MIQNFVKLKFYFFNRLLFLSFKIQIKYFIILIRTIKLGVYLLRISQIFSKDYPNNKKSVFKYESDYYYDVKLQSMNNNNGWIINIQKKLFQSTFKKNVNEVVFKEFLSDAEYYIALNEDRFRYRSSNLLRPLL